MEVISPLTTQPNPFVVTIPFAWEDKPGVPNPFYTFLDQDFAFDVSQEFVSDSVPAEELFDGGVIKFSSFGDLPPSSRSSGDLPPSARSRRTQSLSTHRGWKVPWDEQEEKQIKQQSPATKTIKPQLLSSFSTLSASSSRKGSKRWSFKNLFLFRSASDGRAMDRDPLRKCSAFFRKHDVEFMKSSVKSMEPGAHGSKRRGPVSAHELHYKVNRAVANDMKKKTFLPYKQGILGRSAFNPSVHALSNGFGVAHHHRE
ncbi:hypothetical protein Hanom_Chr05g00445301 [Helianthus anomalus]